MFIAIYIPSKNPSQYIRFCFRHRLLPGEVNHVILDSSVPSVCLNNVSNDSSHLSQNLSELSVLDKYPIIGSK